MTDEHDQEHGERANIAETVRDMAIHYGEAELLLSAKHEDDFLLRPNIMSLPITRQKVDLTEDIRRASEYLTPNRRRGIAMLSDLSSLIAWANRFKGPEMALFANPNRALPSLTCIADYHAKGSIDTASPTGDPSARHMAHRAIYDFPLSDEWTAWMKVAGEPMSKDDLAAFIEARALDVQDPTPAIIKGNPEAKSLEKWEIRLIEMAQALRGRFGTLGELIDISRSFAVFETSSISIKANRDTGEASIQFENDHKQPDGKPIKIPNIFIIAIPVFQNGELFRLPVRFRYRKSGSSLAFYLEPHNADKAFDMAFREAVDVATEETKVPTFYGAPEK